MDKNRKKELLLQCKERKVIGGVYVIWNKESEKMLLLLALDLIGAWNINLQRYVPHWIVFYKFDIIVKIKYLKR